MLQSRVNRGETREKERKREREMEDPLYVARISSFRVFVSTHLTDQKKQSSKNKLRNEDLHNLYAWAGMIRVIKSRRVEWSGYTIQAR
jgi:hypothetical protein